MAATSSPKAAAAARMPATRLVTSSQIQPATSATPNSTSSGTAAGRFSTSSSPPEAYGFLQTGQIVPSVSARAPQRGHWRPIPKRSPGMPPTLRSRRDGGEGSGAELAPQRFHAEPVERSVGDVVRHVADADPPAGADRHDQGRQACAALEQVRRHVYLLQPRGFGHG